MHLYIKATISLIALIFVGFLLFQGEPTSVSSFDECVEQGNPVMESYPRQCVDEAGNHFTEDINPQMTREEALEIARNSKDCSMAGILTHLEEEMSYNAITNTWWFGLERMPELEKDGCNPVCVVNEETKITLVNWRCTGAKPAEERTYCEESQRSVDACIEIYKPVCGTVNIQCITEPCDPIEMTYVNSCIACQNELVESYVEGMCDK